MRPDFGNIFDNIPENLPEELFTVLAGSKACSIERIVSRGHSGPAEDWYDQEFSEWVMVLKGSAELLFEEQNETVSMKPGDYVDIPAHCKHRVVRTDPECETVWIAVRYG